MTTPPMDPEEDEMLFPHSDFATEGPQHIEVASAGTSNTVDDPPSARFTWTIGNFSRLNTKKLYSEVFYEGGYKWRVLIFPKGNNVDHLSMYLDVADSSILPYGWSRYGQFSLAVINQINNKLTMRKETQHQFNASESDWGFTSFMPLSELYDPGRGYLVNDKCVFEAVVDVRRVVDYWSYDSKKEIGYVGLKNQGATSYMNSLLQTLYHIPYFRRAVYHMPTTENDMPAGSIPLALQSLFYKLQYSDTSGSTKELMKSFGWETNDSFMQHDVQELNRVLCEKLEEKMNGTVVEGKIQQLFKGHHMNYIECINVDYKSTRKESFYGLQLDVKGCHDVYASFDKYVETERLEGDNRYHAEFHGLQDARKGVLFIDFPPVLQLQLKRFEYDFMWDTMVKINDRYEFPLELDLDRENGKYLSPETDTSARNLYTLHSVLGHSGGVHGGHYYAYIRPTLSDQWFKFDDECVTKEDMERVLEEQYGGAEELPDTNPFNSSPIKYTKYSNAYMLVYIRESDKEKIICNVDEKDIAEHLRTRLKKEQEEKEHKRKEKAEAHTIIKVARDEDLLEQIGREIYFDLVDHDKVHSFRIQKQMSVNLFKEEVAKELGIPVQFQRFWLWAKRQNRTYRPHRPLTPQEEAETVGQLREVSKKPNNAQLHLFLEVELGQDLRPVPPSKKTEVEILLFFKLYDPMKEELRYVGRLFVKVSGKPVEILAKLNELAGFAPDEEIELFEEIKCEPNVMCEHIDKMFTFQSSQLDDGDIICFQKALQLESSEQCRYPDVPSFLEYVHNLQKKLAKFQIKELKDVLGQLGLVKQGTKQDLVDRILAFLSSEEAPLMHGSTKKKINGKEGVAKIIDDAYRKLQGTGDSNSATHGQSGSNISSVTPREEIIDSFADKKICCPCGRSLQTDYMIECADPNCRVLQHILCVIIPEESWESIPPVPPQFYCEVCRINRADPFWVTMRNLLSPVKLVACNSSIDDTNSLQNLDKEFEITRADRHILENSEYDVQVWCILLNDSVPFRMQWPQFGDLKVNGTPVETVNRLGSQLLGANGRGDGPIVSLYIKEGLNKISLSGSDARSFCVGVRLVKRRTIQQVLNLIPSEQNGEPLANALARVCRCISGGMATTHEDSDSDLEIIADSVTVNLRCPMSGSRMKIASRFKSCAHIGCFDLETYVEINHRTKKWQCPTCLKNFSLEDIIIDPYFNRITKMIEDSGEDITEIDVKSNGSWRAKNGDAFMDLEQWHLPDGSLCVSAVEVVSNMEGMAGRSNSILAKKENRIGVVKVSKPQRMKTHGSGSKVQEYFENYGQNVIKISSSSSESGRDDGTQSINQHTSRHVDISANHCKSSSASFGNRNIIVLSDSD